MRFNGLIIPRSYNEYINKSNIQDIKQTTSSASDNALDASSNQPVKNKVLAAIIPQDAAADNQLATEEYVNESVATNSAYFRGTYDSVEELEAYAGDKTNNDYAWVVSNDGEIYTRYKWNGSAWVYEYELNLANADMLFNVSHPIGEIYVQFPQQAAPATLYGRGTWEDITADYAGLFFRAAGGNAAEFGEVQEDEIKAHSHTYTTTNNNDLARWPASKGSSDCLNANTGAGSNVRKADFTINETGGVETRPRNTAIKIWKRTA